VRVSGANTSVDTLRIPILGPIAAGPFLLVPEPGVDYMNDKEYAAVDIARSLLPSKEKGDNLYALEVKGDSMIDAMINDGDIVVLKPAAEAKNGEMVAVRVNDEYTLKYFFKEKDRFRLQPANPTMKPIMVKKNEPVEIGGKVVMVIRKMDRPLAA
jgi:repressor LexA